MSDLQENERFFKSKEGIVCKLINFSIKAKALVGISAAHYL